MKNIHENLVVIITGANHGIGFHLALTLLEDHCRVAALDISTVNLTELQELYPNHLHVIRCDVSSDDDVSQAVSEVIDKWGRIDVLVNNACIALFNPFEEKKIAEIKREFEVNYFGYIRMINEVLPYMKAQKKGIIHNMSSGVGLTGYPLLAGYTSTKGAIEALTRTLSLEMAGEGITFHTMHPPLTNTKSASPLGLPAEVMSNPVAVGKKLAKKILSTRADVTPDLQTSVFLFFSRRFPAAVGRLLSRLAEKAQKTAGN